MPPTWKTVYDLVKRVPKGQVITYGALARAARLRGGAREAGHALAACPKGRGIPWHRVVGAGGKLLVREPIGSLQRQLLEREGAQFAGSRIKMDISEWLPPSLRKRPAPKITKEQKSLSRSTKKT